MKYLITGGMGFVGSSIATFLRAKEPNSTIYVFDNLKRRGSENNLSLMKELSIKFIHGDIRILSDLEELDMTFDVIIDASAEPAVNISTDTKSSYVIHTNMVGTINILEFTKKFAGKIIFLSTSRVYSIKKLRELPLEEKETRFEIDPSKIIDLNYTGITDKGIAEEFPIYPHRSLYGTTKLASELFIEEYCHESKISATINRCGVIAGAKQWGKTDQGVFSLWVINHILKRPLSYFGHLGSGKQVRDLLHVKDLAELIYLQIQNNKDNLSLYNVGGGMGNSTSLYEYTKMCQSSLGAELEIGKVLEEGHNDIPYFVTDNSKVYQSYNWSPKYTVRDIINDISTWAKQNQSIIASF